MTTSAIVKPTGQTCLGFIEQWIYEYNQQASNIPLFTSIEQSSLSREQVCSLIKWLYHIRGHFVDFLWYVGNFTDNKDFKEIVIDNIREELAPNGVSHEMLYCIFADSHDIDINEEIIQPKYYADFIDDFNQGHMTWLSTHDDAHRIACFSAYEKLDNIDYNYLIELAKNIGTTKTGLTFFQVHVCVEHFENTIPVLDAIWKTKPQAVTKAFDFIANHQLSMWRTLSHKLLVEHPACK